MPSKARRDREKRARAVKLALAKPADVAGPDGATAPGSGSTSTRDESGLTHRESLKLDQMAIRRGWVQLPFPTRTPELKLRQEVATRGDMTIVERAALSVAEGLISGDLRRRGIAERNAIAMESHNLAVERHADQMNRPVAPAAAPTEVQVNVVNRVQILRLPENQRGPDAS